MLNGRTQLHVLDRGFVNRNRYCKEVILSRVCQFRDFIGPDFVFMDDNSWINWTANVPVISLLEREGFTIMDCPASFPDLKFIEHVWYALEDALRNDCILRETPNN
ncbi:transposable element Tcb2 transposase [Trichonephila clavipes]|nr:transposable element Tcb2 transposase [Trichonephila clavipes]